MPIDAKGMTDLAERAAKEKEEESKRRRELLTKEAQVAIPTLLPILEKLVEACANKGCYRAHVFRWGYPAQGDRNRFYDYDNPGFAGTKWEKAETIEDYKIMNDACRQFFNKYKSVINFKELTEYIANHLRNRGFQVEIKPEESGESVNVRWGNDNSIAPADSKNKEPERKPWWKMW